MSTPTNEPTSHATSRFTHITNTLMAISLGVMAVAVFVNVVLRYGFGSGVAASEELSRLLFVWMVFIGATDDARFRAFDARSGATLWTYKLEASAHATPITYLGKDGRQYVAIVATGGSFLDSPIDSDGVFVFALP